MPVQAVMQTADKKLICCLLATEIADYEARPIFDQIRLTQDFHQLLFDATGCVTAHDLISAVGEDRGLLAFLCDPVACFTVALAIRDATLTQDRYRDLQLRIGIDLGKAHIAKDVVGQPYVNGEVREDADRLMRQGLPRQISVSRRFVELLSRSAPELVESLEYQGLYSDNIGPPLCWYRALAPREIESKSVPDQPLVPALSSDRIDTPFQSKLAPIALAMQSMAKLQRRLRRPRLSYALLLLVVGSAIVALAVRVGIEPPIFNPTVQIGVATPQSPAADGPASSPEQAESLVGPPDSPTTPVAPQETIGSEVMAPPELVEDSRQAQPAALSMLPEPAEDAAVAGPRGELRARGKVDRAVSPEKKQKRSRRPSKNMADEEAQLPAKEDAITDSMLTCARIEVLRKRLECFDKIKRRSAKSAQ
jgi:hypothetical protein